MDEHIKSLTRPEFARFATPLEQIYHQHAAAIFAYLCLHISSREEAEDLLLEVFLAALEYPALVAYGIEAQRAWLHGVAHRKVVDYYRKTSRRQSIPLDHITEMVVVDDAPGPEQLLMQREGDERILSALRRLPALQQQVLSLHFGYGLRSAEIASILHKREAAVRKLLSRAVNAIRILYLENKEKQP